MSIDPTTFPPSDRAAFRVYLCALVDVEVSVAKGFLLEGDALSASNVLNAIAAQLAAMPPEDGGEQTNEPPPGDTPAGA